MMKSPTMKCGISNTIRIEKVIEVTLNIIRQSHIISLNDLYNKVNLQIHELRLGDFRSAIWQIVDGNAAKFISDEELKSI